MALKKNQSPLDDWEDDWELPRGRSIYWFDLKDHTGQLSMNKVNLLCEAYNCLWIENMSLQLGSNMVSQLVQVASAAQSVGAAAAAVGSKPPPSSASKRRHLSDDESDEDFKLRQRRSASKPVDVFPPSVINKRIFLRFLDRKSKPPIKPHFITGNQRHIVAVAVIPGKTPLPVGETGASSDYQRLIDSRCELINVYHPSNLYCVDDMSMKLVSCSMSLYGMMHCASTSSDEEDEEEDGVNELNDKLWFVICDKKPKLSELPKLHKKFTAVAFNKHKELIAARKFIITRTTNGENRLMYNGVSLSSASTVEQLNKCYILAMPLVTGERTVKWPRVTDFAKVYMESVNNTTVSISDLDESEDDE